MEIFENKPIDSITIVGGGSAGWLTAAILSYQDPNIKISVIDKEVSTRVGVGEATILDFGPAMLQAGFDTHYWFNRIDATIKSGILFSNWNYKEVWHPFYVNVFYDSLINDLPVSNIDIWSNHQHLDFNRHAVSNYEINVEEKSVNISNIQSKKIAYHIDAVKLALFLEEEVSKRRNVSARKSEVVNIIRDDSNNITGLELADGSTCKSDLYIDCTGFARILCNNINKVTTEGRLFCDTAIATPVQYIDQEEEMVPYTRCEQVDHGWIWTTPTQKRIGTGIVFNRAVTDPETAKQFLYEYWNKRVDLDSCKVIDWTPHYISNPWQNNVVAIGLSNGFIEPLESTGLSLIIQSALALTANITSRQYNSSIQQHYNNHIGMLFENCIDFVSMHYSNSTRQTPFWDYVRENFTESQSQKYYKQKFASDKKLNYNPPTPTNIFAESNWAILMTQLGFEYGTKQCGDKDWLYKNMMAQSFGLGANKKKLFDIIKNDLMVAKNERTY